MHHIVRTLLRIATQPDSPAAASDPELLARFARDRDEGAFAALVDRHGPMILGVAHRILRDRDAADDVFQATFLALARSASAVHRPGGLPAWLHRTALRAAVKRARVRRPGALVVDPPAVAQDPLDTLTGRELLAALDEEIRRLPAPLRSAVVACCLEGLSQEEAARALGWTAGQVRGRLERGRRRLGDRLARRGLALSAGGMVLMTPAPILTAELRANAVRLATGKVTASQTVAALAASVGRTLPVRITIALTLGLAAVGLAGLTPGSAPYSPTYAPVPPSAGAALRGDLPAGAVRRFGTARDRVGSGPIAVSPDGTTLVTVSHKGGVRVLDTGTGRVASEHLLPMSPKALYSDYGVILSTDGSTAVTGVNNGDATGNTLTAWNLTTRASLWTLTAVNGGTTDHVALSADGRRLVVVEPSADWRRSSVRTVDLGTGRAKAVADLAAQTRRTFLAPDGKRIVLAVGGDDAMAGICLDADTGAKLWTTPRLGRRVAFSTDGTLLFAITSMYGPLLVLDAATGKPGAGVKAPEQVADLGLPPVTSADGRTVLVGDVKMRGYVLWDYQAGKELGVVPAYSYTGGYPDRAAAFSADGKTLFTTFDRLRRWDAGTGKPLDAADPSDAHNAPVAGVRFSADGREVYTLGTDRRFGRWGTDGRLLETGDAKVEGFARPGEGAVFRAGWTVMAFDRFAVAASVPEKAPEAPAGGIWLRGSLFPPPLLTVPIANGRGSVTLTDASIGDKRALRVSGSGPNRSDLVMGAELPWTRAVPAHPVSPCGRWIVLDGKVYSVATGHKLFAPEAPGIGGRPARLTTDPMRFERVWFSPDGRFLAGTLDWQDGTAPATRLVAVWELASGSAFPTVPVHLCHDAAVSPGGRTLVDGGIQGIIARDLFAGTSSQLPRRDLSTGYDYRQSQPIGFNPSGRTFVTGHADGSVIEWAVPHAARVSAAPTADAAWADLGSPELWRARAAVERFVDHPDAAGAILKLKFAPPTDARRGDERGNDPEIPVSGDALRAVRAIEILERTATPPARKLLEGWRDQTRRPRLATEARFALDRLGPAGGQTDR